MFPTYPVPITSVVDPDSLNPDLETYPDPAFQVNLDPVPYPVPDPWVLMKKNWKKIQLEKKIIFFDQKIAIYQSLGLLRVRPSYRRILSPALQNMKCISFFVFLWVIFAFLFPDPQH